MKFCYFQIKYTKAIKNNKKIWEFEIKKTKIDKKPIVNNLKFDLVFKDIIKFRIIDPKKSANNSTLNGYKRNG